MDKPRFLIVRNLEDRSEVHRVEVTGYSERNVELTTMGMLRNLRDDCFITDSRDETGED